MNQSRGGRSDPEAQRQMQRIFLEQSRDIHIRVDRGFSILLLIQWVAAVIMGIVLTPTTWLGSFSGAVENAFVGLIFGGLFSLPAVYCVYVFPGEKWTRYVVAESNQWRWLEHAAWILIEDIILIIGIERIRGELQEMAYSKYQLVQAREEALQLSSIKSTFLSNMSHEIRTPLNSIIGFSDILRDTNLDKDQTDYVRTIQRCSDSHRLRQILMNLVGNAVKFTDRGWG